MKVEVVERNNLFFHVHFFSEAMASDFARCSGKTEMAATQIRVASFELVLQKYVRSGVWKGIISGLVDKKKCYLKREENISARAKNWWLVSLDKQ